MNTSVYISPSDILSVATAMVGDRDYKIIPRGFYMSLIQEAFEKLAIDTFFQELRADFDFPIDTLTLPLPEGCFNVKNVYMFSGTECNITKSHKVYWKRNYFTRGVGFIANDKGNQNLGDPFYANHSLGNRYGNHETIRFDGNIVNQRLFYNLQMGNIMLSSSCASMGNKVHIHYNGTGCAIGDVPIIPIFLRQAMEDFVIEAALRFRIANDPVNARNWMAVQQLYDKRLNQPYEGSWEKAEQRIKFMNSSQREELGDYLGHGGWGSGF
jgi:hypothetical protein